MSNPFEAAIKCLLSGGEVHLSNAARWDELKEYSAAEERRSLAKEFTAAIRILEAAGKVDTGKALTAMTWIPAKTPGFMELHALCSALPDEQVKRGCPNPEDYPKISDIEQLSALPDEVKK